jgi:transposase InsO family protein
MDSDHGSQFTSRLYRETLENKGFRQNMGRTGSCYDNARMESFFATLKKELIYKLPMFRLTYKEVRFLVFKWI